MKPVGPVEVLVVRFPGNKFTGELAPALTELVETGTVRILDLIFITKDTSGNVVAVELADLAMEEAQSYDGAVTDLEGVLTEDDVAEYGELLENNSSAALLLFENTWAARFAQALRNADGEVVLNERIPRAVIDELVWENGA